MSLPRTQLHRSATDYRSADSLSRRTFFFTKWFSFDRATVSAAIPFALAALALFCSGTVHARPLPPVSFSGVVSTVNLGSLTINAPQGVAVDPAGNIYIADTLDGRIIKVTPAGTASVLSISGLTLPLNDPSGLTLDSAGNLYIADGGNARVVEVTPAGVGSVLSTGSVTLSDPVGVAVDGSGNIFVSDFLANQIVKIPSSGPASVFNITGLGTPLNNPVGLAVDTFGNLYIADDGNARVVEVHPSGSALVINTNGILASATGVAVTRDGVLYISDFTSNWVLVVDSQGNLSYLLNGAPTLNGPIAVAVNTMGTVYVANHGDNTIDSFQPSSANFGHVQLPASSTMSLSFRIAPGTTLTSVTSYTSGAQNLDFTIGNSTTCVASFTNGICSVNVAFTPSAAGLRSGGIAMNFSTVSSSGSFTLPLFGFADAPAVFLSPAVGNPVYTGTSTVVRPYQSAIDGAGNIYVTSFTSGGNLYEIPAVGGPPAVVSTGNITLNFPTGVAIDPAGNIFVSDYANNRIVEVPVGGTAVVYNITGLTTPLNSPITLAFDGAGNLYIDDSGNSRIVEVNPAGQGVVLSTGSFTFAPADVAGLAVDSTGNIYLPDYGGDQVIKIDPYGNATQVALGSVGNLNGPFDVAVDGNGNLFILDSNNQRIIQVTTSGAASILALSPTGTTFSAYAFGLMVDASDDVIVDDSSNNRLIKFSATDASLTFAATNVGQTSSDSPKAGIVTNLGDQPLVVAATAGFTANFVQNLSDPNSCTTVASVAPGGSCDVSVSFTPQTFSPTPAEINISDNALNVVGAMQGFGAIGSTNPVLPAITWTQPSPILSGASLSGVLDATATNNGSAVPGTFAYTATTQGGSPVSVTSATVLAAGTYTLSANFTPTNTYDYQAVSFTVTLTVEDFTFNLSANGTVTSQTVSPGGTATFTFTIAPSGNTFPAAVTFSATGLPTGATATFTPASIASGAGATSVTLTIQLPATSAANRIAPGFFFSVAFAPTLIGLVFLPFSRKARRIAATRTRIGAVHARVGLLLLAFSVVTFAAALAGCGSTTPASSTNNTTPTPQNYSVVVTATSGSSSHSTTLTLTVQ